MNGSNKQLDNLDGRSTLLEEEQHGLDNIYWKEVEFYSLGGVHHFSLPWRTDDQDYNTFQ
jgi:hypothetical protein